MGSVRSKLFRRLGIGVFGIALVAVSIGLRMRYNEEHDTSNYQVLFPPASPWVERPHSPEALFLYQDPMTHIEIRGAVVNVVADTNPTPGLDTNGLAALQMDVTSEHMGNVWKAQRLADHKTPVARFAVVRRDRDGKTVITAWVEKGNTSLAVGLMANGKETQQVAKVMPYFYSLLDKIRLQPTVIQ